MLMEPEVRTAILRVSVATAVALICVVGAFRAPRRWLRILLTVLAVPITLCALFGMLIVSLMLRYGSR
jgi:hypothetical protein